MRTAIALRIHRLTSLGLILVFSSVVGLLSCDDGGQRLLNGSEGTTGTGGAVTSGDGQGGGAAPAGTGGQAGGQIPGGGTALDEFQAIVGSYSTWQPMSAVPVDISAQIFGLCRLPTAAEQAFTASAHGPFALRTWANPEAAAAITAQGDDGFPAGATIVKQKFSTSTSGDLTLAALGIMIKRQAGSRMESGDWDYAYWSVTGGLSRDAAELASCAGCHYGNPSATDSVFLDGSWR